MRVVLATTLGPDRSATEAVASALRALGHTAKVLCEPGAGAKAEATLTARLTKTLLLERPKVALLEASPSTSATAAALRAARLPYLLWVSEALSSAGPPSELASQALRMTCEGAAAVVVSSDEVAEHLARFAGLEDMELLQAGVRLEDLPLGDRAEAKAALRLPADMAVIGLVGRLSADTALDVLSLAHRQMPGVALLVAGDGPEEATIFAMASATRPSSPVIHVGPRSPATRVVTACAADVGLALDRHGPSEESWSFAALGRRQVTFDVDGTDVIAAVYPEHRTVFAAPVAPEPLREIINQALAEERRAGPLPPAAVADARAHLDQATRWPRLGERVLACA